MCARAGPISTGSADVGEGLWWVVGGGPWRGRVASLSQVLRVLGPRVFDQGRGRLHSRLQDIELGV